MTRTTPFVVTVDMGVDAAYISMADRPVARTVAASDDVQVDLDEFGVVVGIEVLTVDADIPFDRLVTEFHVHTKDVEYLRLLRPSIQRSIMQNATDGSSRQNVQEGSLSAS